MANKNLGVLILIATIVTQATLVPAAEEASSGPVEYVVGDDKGWAPNVDYDAWVMGKDFYMGDTLVFNYTKGEHDVIKVDEAAYAKCAIPPNNEMVNQGNDVIMLMTMGGNWFISGVGQDCDAGMKLHIPNVKCPHTRPKALQAGRKLIPSNEVMGH